MNTELQIARLTSEDVARAAEVQGRAFFDDPAFMFTLPDAAARRERLPWLMGVGIGYGERYGEVVTTAGDMLGHAVWLPPGETSLAEERMSEFGFDRAAERLGDEALKRFGDFMEHMSAHHDRLMPARHWYLMILGVEPDRQGQGIGSTLIRPALERADADRLPCYLETAKERNLAFYRRHGFEVRHEEPIPGGGPNVWMMVRDPR